MSRGPKQGLELRGTDDKGSAPAPRFGGHFAGIMLDMEKVDFSGRKYVIAGPSASGGMVSLEGIELLLAERATELGVDLRRGMAVTNFTEDENGVTVQAGTNRFRGDGWSAATAAAAQCEKWQDLNSRALSRSSPATPHR